jgi:hypothetical protein
MDYQTWGYEARNPENSNLSLVYRLQIDSRLSVNGGHWFGRMSQEMSDADQHVLPSFCPRRAQFLHNSLYLQSCGYYLCFLSGVVCPSSSPLYSTITRSTYDIDFYDGQNHSLSAPTFFIPCHADQESIWSRLEDRH